PLSAAGCQKAVVAPLADYLRRVPELGPRFGNDHPNCGSMEARRSSEFYGCCRVRRHRGNFAGTHTGKTKAERSRYPITAAIIGLSLLIVISNEVRNLLFPGPAALNHTQCLSVSSRKS